MGKQKSIGFFLILVICFSCFWAAGLLPIQYGTDTSDIIYITSRTAMIVSFIVCALIFYFVKPNITYLGRIVVITMIVSVLLEVLRFVFETSDQESLVFWLGTAANVLEGVLTACVILLIAWLLCPCSLTGVSIAVPASLAIAHILFLLIGLLPEATLIWFKLIFLAGPTVGLFILTSRDTALDTATVPPSADPQPSTKAARISPFNSMSWSLLLGIIVFPFLYGLMSQICTLADIDFDFYNLSTEIVAIVFLALLAVGTLLWKNRIDAEMVFIIVCPIFATAFLFVPLFWENEIFASGFIMKCGLLIFLALVWISLCRLSHGDRRSALFSFSVAFGLYYLMSIGGRLLAYALSTRVSFSLVTTSTIALVLVWILSMAALVVILITNRRRRAATTATSSYDDSLTEFAATYGLSDRELTICREYARGRTVEYISSLLNVSPETVKTHLKRMYAKTSCHSRQDLIDLIESMQEDADTAAEQ